MIFIVFIQMIVCLLLCITLDCPLFSYDTTNSFHTLTCKLNLPSSRRNNRNSEIMDALAKNIEVGV